MLIGYRKEFFNLASRASAFRQSDCCFVVLESKILVEFKNLEVRK